MNDKAKKAVEAWRKRCDEFRCRTFNGIEFWKCSQLSRIMFNFAKSAEDQVIKEFGITRQQFDEAFNKGGA